MKKRVRKEDKERETDSCGPSLWVKIWIGKAVRGTLLAFILFAFYGGLFGKAEYSGWEDFFTFFTNLSWCVYAIFYTAVVLGLCFPPLRHVAILILYVPVVNLALFVWIMLQIIIASQPKLLDDLKEMPSWMVWLGNEFYHPFPLILIFGFSILTYGSTFGVLQYVWNQPNIPYFLHIINAIWQIYFPLILSAIYCIGHNPMVVYGIVGMSTLEVVAIGFLVNTVIGGLVFLFAFPYTENHSWFRMTDITQF